MDENGRFRIAIVSAGAEQQKLQPFGQSLYTIEQYKVDVAV